MSRAHTTRAAMAPALAVAIALSAAADVERTCPGAPGVGIVEFWNSIPANGLRFDLAKGIGSITAPDTRPANGLPNSLAVMQQCNIMNSIDLPIEQSFARAAATWSNATMPGTTAPATSFQIDPVMTRFTGYPDWMTYQNMPIQSSPLLSGTPGTNLVTFWENPAVMNLFGQLTLGVALVDLIPGTGIIRDADIAMNAMGTGAGTRALFRFVEDNVALGTTITTLGYNESTATGLDPILGYVDIQGVLTHELGHAAGLAHSLIDGPTNQLSSSTPTMFAVAQIQPYSGNVAWPLAGCTTTVTTQANGLATQFGGIAGVPARDLMADDIAAISVAYPGPGQSQLGAISGRVETSVGAGVRAAHVVAISTTAPEVVQVGTFSDSLGNYVIDSLPPGDYVILAEGADINGYFANTGLPEFIDPGFNCGGPPTFETELLNVGDSSNEALPMEATPFTVSAGSTTVATTFRVEPVAGAQLLTSACFDNGGGASICGPSSARGSVHNNLASLNANVRLDMVGGTPGGLGIIFIGIDRIYAPFGTQRIAVNPLPGGSVTLGLDAAGAAFVALPVNSGLLGMTFYGQAAELNLVTGNLEFTNAVTMRFDAN